MKAKAGTVAGLVALLLVPAIAGANDVPSSTMYFHGALTDNGDSTYTGVVAMIDEGDPDSGYDIYAKEGGTAWFGDDPGSGPVWTSQAIGAGHDAWPTWTPDTPDWYQYSLNLYVDGSQQKWAVRNHPGATADHPWNDDTYWGSPLPPMGVPMSGAMDWVRMYAKETDVGAYLPGTGTAEIPGGAAGHGGGAGAWDMDWSWGSEVVPLEMPGFQVTITENPGGSGEYDVELTPKANTIPSSTMHFEGTLTDAGGGIYTGTIDMTAGAYFVTGGDGAHIGTAGGFDVYAKEGGCAYVQGYYGDNPLECDGHDSATVGADHDAYPVGGPWGTWYDPDCADWGQYELELTADHWYLRYKPTDESPMSGTINWTTMYAAESDLGTQDGGHDGSAAHGGGAGAWDWDCGWGVEVIPLQLPGFNVTITEDEGTYHVTMAPGGITIDVFASSAPNAYGSPSWSAYVVNALNALENNLATVGDRSTDPTAYERAPAQVPGGEIAVTSFHSWRGVVDPPSPFENENGNRMHFGLHAYGDGINQFTLEDLTFEMHSSDATDSLAFAGDFIGYDYSSTRYGIDWGADGAKGGGDDTTYTSGNGTTPVDEIVYVGVGNAWWPGYCPAPCDPADPPEGKQGAMDDYFAWLASVGPIDVTCTYGFTGSGDTGSDTVTIVPPEELSIYPSLVPDEQEPRVNLGDAPATFEPDSWRNSETGKVNWHARYLADGDFLSALFPGQAATLTINDLESISYWTKRPDGTAAGQDWAVFIYTRPPGDASWYGKRFVNNYEEHTATDAWTQYSTASGMTFRKNSGTPTGLMSFDDLKASYGTELIEMISVQTMSNWSGVFDGYMDGLIVTLTDGTVGRVDFVRQPTLTLEPDDECYEDGETVTVDLWMHDVPESIVGGQFFLEYNTGKLTFVGATAVSPFAQLYLQFPSAGQIDYAVQITPPGSVTGDALIATLTFTADAQICTELDLITWRSHDPPTRLSDHTGGAVYPDLVAMDVDDDEAPTITCPSDVTIECDESTDPSHTGTPGHFQGFEDPGFTSNTEADWNDYNSSLSRVASGIGGILSKSGGFHAVIDSTSLPPSPDDFTGAFSRLGGYDSTFGGGFSVSLDVYMDLSDPAVTADTYGWDLSTAANNQSGDHLRDFIFHTASNASGNILVAGSNNTNFTRRNDLATINHHTITSTGWYTFQWVFRDAGDGSLAVDLNLLDASGAWLWTETRNDPSDLIATIVGGHRYMWFTFLEVDMLAIDNTKVSNSTQATDNCDPAPTITYSDVPDLTGCNGTGTIMRTWTATDACGNFAECVQVITVVDTTPPVVTPPAVTELECSTEISSHPAATTIAEFLTLSGAEASDNCTAQGDLTVSSSDSGLVGDECSGTITRTYTITDDCDNSTDVDHVFNVSDNTDPEIDLCPENITVNADAGGCTAVVTWTNPTASDNCDTDVDVTCVPASGSVFGPGGPTTVTCTAEDDCGNTDTCDFDVTVSAYNELVVNVDMEASFTGSRCITFELWECGPDTYETVEQEITFSTGSATNVTVLVPCDYYDCITARDRLHTLRRTDEGFTISGTQYEADFTGDPGSGGDWLIGGNLNDDYWIDILDFGVFSWQWNVTYGSPATGDTTCETGYPHADISGDGLVTSGDFAFISGNFLDSHEPNCCEAPLFGEDEGGHGPITEISVAELIELGLGDLAVADLNHDGWLDVEDVEAFMAGVRPRHPVPADTVDVEKVPATPQTRP